MKSELLFNTDLDTKGIQTKKSKQISSQRRVPTPPLVPDIDVDCQEAIRERNWYWTVGIELVKS